MVNLPKVYLWAWERPEDLRFLGDKKVGVAFLAKTLSLAPPNSTAKNGFAPSSESLNCDREDSASTLSPVLALECGSVLVRPRMQPLRIIPGTPLMAVVRIESIRSTLPSAYATKVASPPAFSKTQLDMAAAEISSTARITGVSAVQIDFDATLSEHDFYRALLVEVRKQLPPNIPLSITALASWCIGDRWLEQLPPGTIDEAVPMLFRMGTGEREVSHYISSGEELRVGVCRGSVGVSTDEPISQQILTGKISAGGGTGSSRRIYVFSPSAWSQEPAETILREIQLWHAN